MTLKAKGFTDNTSLQPVTTCNRTAGSIISLCKVFCRSKFVINAWTTDRDDTLQHWRQSPSPAGSWIPSDLELSHTTASSFQRNRWRRLVWITACPRKTCRIKLGICRWAVQRCTLTSLFAPTRYVVIIHYFFILTEADSTRYKVWPKASFSEKKWGRWGQLRWGRGSA